MKKNIGLFLFFIVMGVGGYYIIRTYLPNLAPPSKNIKLYLPLNSDTPSPLKIASGYRMDIFSDLNGGKPEFMAFDDEGILYARDIRNNTVFALYDEDKNLKAERKVRVQKETITENLDDPISQVEQRDGSLLEIKDNKIVKYEVFGGQINGEEDFVSGFTQPNGEILGTITDLAIDKTGNIYVSDSKTGLIYVILK